jgi:hypothetical protein
MSRRRKSRFRLGRAGRSYLSDAIKMIVTGAATLAVIGGSVYLAMLIGSW